MEGAVNVKSHKVAMVGLVRVPAAWTSDSQTLTAVGQTFLYGSCVYL